MQNTFSKEILKRQLIGKNIIIIKNCVKILMEDLVSD